jgi:predicted nucleic acid-binding protein
MKIGIDLNVLLDVAQNRLGFYPDSEEVLARAREGEFEGVISSHLITTFHYLMEKFSGTPTANTAVDGLLADFAIAAPDKAILLRARALPISDFEDSVVAAVAEAAGCDYIVTRNVQDFVGSPVPSLTPAQFLDVLPGLAISEDPSSKS